MAGVLAIESILSRHNMHAYRADRGTDGAHARHSLSRSAIVFLGTFFMLSLAPFYGWLIIIALSLACGAVAYFWPGRGVGLSFLLFAPALAYQSFAMFSIALVPLAIIYALDRGGKAEGAFIRETLGYFSDRWHYAAFLQIAVCAAFFPVKWLGVFTYLALCAGALYTGPKGAAILSASAVLLILLLSTLWGVTNNALIAHFGGEEQYRVMVNLLINQKPPLLGNPAAQATSPMGGGYSANSWVSMFAGIGSPFYIILSIFSGAGQLLIGIFSGIPQMASNIFKLFLSDIAAFQLAVFCLPLYFMPKIAEAARCRGLQPGFPHAIASLAMIAIPIAELAPLAIFSSNLDSAVVVFLYVICCVFMVAMIETAGASFPMGRNLNCAGLPRKKGTEGIAIMVPYEAQGGLSSLGGYANARESAIAALGVGLACGRRGGKPGAAGNALLFGPPGCGKTAHAKAIAKDANASFFFVSCREISPWGEAASAEEISNVFMAARKNEPALIFFDDIDMLAVHGPVGKGNLAIEELSSKMDGARVGNARISVLAATSRPEVLGENLMEGAGFGARIYLGLPSEKDREEIFAAACKGFKLSGSVDFKRLAKESANLSCKDISEAVMRAKKACGVRAHGLTIPTLTHVDLLAEVHGTVPSISDEDAARFEGQRLDFENPHKPGEPVPGASSFSDLVGHEAAKAAMLAAAEEMKMPSTAERRPDGILLFGPKGCGKSMLLRAASTIGGMDAFYISAGSNKRIGDAFRRAAARAPSMILLDGLDEVCKNQDGQMQGASRMLALIESLSGKPVLVIAASDNPGAIAPGVLESNFFRRKFHIKPPEKEEREGLFKVCLDGFAEPDFDFNACSAKSAGRSRADIVAICAQAKSLVMAQRMDGKRASADTESILTIMREIKPSLGKAEVKACAMFAKGGNGVVG
jgi:SpoVK/Ycf46/Vps4 family AAA+-type ATPase